MHTPVETNILHPLKLAYTHNHFFTRLLLPKPNRFTRKEHWDQLWKSIRAHDSPPYKDIVEAYSEKHRHYHTLDHIHSMLSLQRYTGQIWQDDTVIKLAIWYHDIVEDPRKDTNVDVSIRWATRDIIDVTGSQKLASKVARLIDTSNYSEEKNSLSDAQKVFTDLDLAILGQFSLNYKIYTKQIRREYSFYSDSEFKFRRIKVLEWFLSRPNIFQTQYFQEKLEENARRNITNEMKEL